jgi:HK97 gp10 family phage protein
VNINITLEGQAEFDSKIQAIISKASGPGLQAALMEGGKLIETAAKGFAPVDTGRLRSSINTEAQGENTVIVAPHVDYAMYQEFGTKNQSGTPFMKPGFESSRDAAVSHIKAKLAAAMKG